MKCLGATCTTAFQGHCSGFRLGIPLVHNLNLFRIKESKISKATFDSEKMIQHFQALMKEAHLLLIFLKSVERISFCILKEENDQPQLAFSGPVYDRFSDMLQLRSLI
jgi:hypothetical protein